MNTRVKPPVVQAIAEACNAQTHLTEAIESLGAYQSPFLPEADEQFAEAMRSIARARAAVQEAIRKRDGLKTIAESVG